MVQSTTSTLFVAVDGRSVFLHTSVALEMLRATGVLEDRLNALEDRDIRGWRGLVNFQYYVESLLE